MNKKQKNVLISAIILIVIVFAVWAGYGMEIFTKNKVFVEMPLTDIEKALGLAPTKTWQDKFIPGLDAAFAASAVISIISGLLIFLFKNKKKDI